jgi:hypothetical protein
VLAWRNHSVTLVLKKSACVCLDDNEEARKLAWHCAFLWGREPYTHRTLNRVIATTKNLISQITSLVEGNHGCVRCLPQCASLKCLFVCVSFLIFLFLKPFAFALTAEDTAKNVRSPLMCAGSLLLGDRCGWCFVFCFVLCCCVLLASAVVDGWEATPISEIGPARLPVHNLSAALSSCHHSPCDALK